MASEQFSLCWDNFHKNMSSGMNSLLENEDLVDVTLAVEGKCLKAHKMVLSVCSPYFKELFKSNPCQHPIVFMKDVSYVALSDLLQFMYQGEVQVSQENLTTFIKTAEALQIKGLTGDGNGSADTDIVETTNEKPVHQIEEYKPAPRSKKQPATITQSPSVKRPRLSVSSSDSQPLPPAVAKTEPVATTPSGALTEPPVQFKMEPYDQSQSLIDETGDENFGDDTLDDANVDDTEDYSMMEGGVGEEEPQAGTSTDGAGEGQDKNMENSRRTSMVWKFFSCDEEGKSTSMATCNLCNKVLSYKSTVSNLRRHIQRRHPLKIRKTQMKKPGVVLSMKKNIAKSRRTSEVWKFFLTDEESENKALAMCKICKQLFSYKSTITNLRKHLIVKHTSKFRKNRQGPKTIFITEQTYD